MRKWEFYHIIFLTENISPTGICRLAKNCLPHYEIEIDRHCVLRFEPLLRARMVRLITHNLLACHAKGCTSNNFPLQLKDVQVELRDAEYNADFLRGFISRIEWPALVDAARQVRAVYSPGPLCRS